LTSTNKLESHLSKVHGIKNYICPYCSIPIARKQALKEHIEYKHDFKCKHCDYTTPYSDQYITHLHLHRNTHDLGKKKKKSRRSKSRKKIKKSARKSRKKSKKRK